eukprot:CAMPEP_0204328048 /NCGR_PEP_ID=MMETSP0469-20131031/13073_1 /ASSEMBLY_ACC=CAM_ASM_000384 /TAXON_ID=2969 /ORGANISM="Oxyrrhis marina" /LENGTH=51 /DNA_ID=CAMNT_0051310379 /DNA_START=390 /DNA_END=545 /DNA_ORIENTATION=-
MVPARIKHHAWKILSTVSDFVLRREAKPMCFGGGPRMLDPVGVGASSAEAW